MKKSIFTKLIRCFIAFVVLFIVDILLLVIVQATIAGGGDMERLMPQNNIDADGSIKDLNKVTDFGGWVETLDDNNNVIEVQGEKRSEKRCYTEDEIYDMTSMFGKSEFIGFIIKPENCTNHYLFVYSRDRFEFTPTIVLNKEKGTVSYNLSKIFTVLFLLLVLAEIIILSTYLRRKIKKPLRQLSDGMTRIQSGENGVVLDIKTEAEFSQIVDTFNTMTAELERQKDENRKLVEQKNRLLLDLSHDLRTPVATIKSCANALEAGLVPEDKLQSYYSTIEMKANRVQVLSEDMFFMLKADSPEDKLNTEDTDVCEFLRMLCAEYYDEIEEAGFEFDIDIFDGVYRYPIDKRMFARVIGNLLTNAKKYNLSGNMIRMVCTSDNGALVIRVCDDGDPIDSELAEQMFSPFVRGDKTRSSVGGTGLGLAISRKIIEKHEGTLIYKRDEDQNVFEISLK